MSTIEIFEIEDDFDPLEDLRIDKDEIEPDSDYLVPIPDAELSKVPEPVVLSPKERIDALLKGIPGAHFRLLYPVTFCREPHNFSEIIESLDEKFPQKGSVYSAGQIVQLLENAGALKPVVLEGAEDNKSDIAQADHANEQDQDSSKNDTDLEEVDYLSVNPTPPRIYTATAAGLSAFDAYCGDHLVLEMLAEEVRYLPLYQRILEMTSAEEGCQTATLNQAVDPDPLCKEPTRFCSYFLNRLEETGAIAWHSSWLITDLGNKILSSDLFDEFSLQY